LIDFLTSIVINFNILDHNAERRIFLPDSFVLCKMRRISLRVVSQLSDFNNSFDHPLIRTRWKSVGSSWGILFEIRRLRKLLINLFSISIRVYNRNFDQQLVSHIFLIFREIQCESLLEWLSEWHILVNKI